MPEVFSNALTADAKKNLEKKGLDGADVKDILVVMGSHFNDEMDGIRNSLRQFRTIGSRVNYALWAIAFSIIGSLIAALIKLK